MESQRAARRSRGCLKRRPHGCPPPGFRVVHAVGLLRKLIPLAGEDAPAAQLLERHADPADAREQVDEGEGRLPLPCGCKGGAMAEGGDVLRLGCGGPCFCLPPSGAPFARRWGPCLGQRRIPSESSRAPVSWPLPHLLIIAGRTFWIDNRTICPHFATGMKR